MTRRRQHQRWWIAGAVAVIAAAVVVGVLLAGRGDDDPEQSFELGGFTGGDFHSLVVDPGVSERLFVGGHQAVSVSDDGGKSWRRLDALDDVDAMGWGFATQAIWISGHPGIVVTSDGGETAEPRNDALPDSDIHAFGAGDDVLYAAGPGVGVIVSRDDAESWQSVSTVDGQSFFGQIVVDAGNPQHLLAADAARGPVVSDDGGETWEVLTTFPAGWVSAAGDFESIYASSPEGAVTSDDGGVTWEPLDVPDGTSLVEADANVDGRLYAGVHDGSHVTVFVSDDAGRTWRQP